MYTVTENFSKEQVKLDSVFPIELYCLNASNSGWEPLYYANINQDIYGYTVNASGNVGATEVIYTGLPIKSGNFQSDVQGEVPGLTISVPNTDRTIESLIQSRNYLRGNSCFKIIMYSVHLPSGSTSYHIGTDDDYTSHIKEKFYIDSCTSNQEVVVFSLQNKLNIKNITVPGRTYSRECDWALKGRYAGDECDPEENINTTTYPSCDGSLDSCRIRGNSERFGGFPSVPRRGIVIV